jgi:uncharacterized sulfatase
MEVGGVKPPDGMYGRSLLPVLQSDKSGQVDPERTWVVTGRERHVGRAREENLPYPMRALRTSQFVYVRNFAPDRWPLGSPNPAGAAEGASQETLESNTHVTFADMDASPTKAWLIAHRDDPKWSRHYDLAFGKRPAEELYDLSKDPDQVHNVAADGAYATQKAELSQRLMTLLKDASDPRVTDDGQTFDRPPFTDAPAEGANKGKGKGKKK